jgi:uncharacterized membrane protein
MADWIAISELFRNAAITVAAIVGAVLAWRQLSPAALQAKSANAQAELARRAHVQAYLRVGNIDYGDDEPPIDVQEITKVLQSRLGGGSA